MKDLIARLETVTGPDRELDEAITRLCSPGTANFCDGMREPFPFYTSSLDAALSLVPEGCDWCAGFVTLMNEKHERSRSGRAQVFDDWPEFAATPALAFCIAALKARAAA